MEITCWSIGTGPALHANVGQPNIVVRGATTLVTRRTVLRKAFLGPWHPMVSAIWLYALADAQRHTKVAVHLSTLMPNHHHTLATPEDDDGLPQLTRRLHRDVSCAIHDLLKDERYDTPRNLWDARDPHYLRLMDPAAQISSSLYTRWNPVAAGIVDKPEHMPGPKIDFGHWKSRCIVVSKPPVYFGKRRPKQLELEITPPPLLYRAFGGDTERLIHHLKRLEDEGVRDFRRARKRKVVGAKMLRRTHPWSEPTTLRESGGQPVPTFRVGARDILGRKARQRAEAEVTGFRREHREAHLAWRDGDREVEFPFGTYGRRVLHDCCVAEMHPEAYVTRPGPTLDEVKDELRHVEVDEGQAEAERDASRELLAEVKDALAAQIEMLADDAQLDVVDPHPMPNRPAHGANSSPAEPNSSPTEPPAEDAAESTPVTRHRFAKGRVTTDAADRPSRVVVKRDKRRGRRSGDPPE